MSLDCYPLGERRVITITDQSLVQDVVYDDDLLITVVDQCTTIVVFNLRSENIEDNKVARFNLGEGITIEQVVYCSTGDYIACICNNNDVLAVDTVFEWRQQDTNKVTQPLNIFRIDLDGLAYVDERKNPSTIDCCQKSGNLAIGCGETVFIYRYLDDDAEQSVQDISHHHNHHTTTGSRIKEPPEVQSARKRCFQHIISIKLTISALKLCLLENYISITAVDHVQVLKLELIPLQIQPDECLASDQQATISHHTNNTSSSFNNNNYHKTSTDTNANSTTNGTLSSILSDSNSAENDYSLFNTTAAANNNNTDNTVDQNLRTSGLDDISIITKNNKAEVVRESNRYSGGDSSEGTLYTSESVDGCITWNLNTKRLVKLPTLMHNSSTNLSSYHICHPFELLGPASETIACRVEASVHSVDFCQNQLEAIVMLCKQFDNDLEPVKASHLQAVYLSNYEDQQRLNKSGASRRAHMMRSSSSNFGNKMNLLKSKHHELVNSVTCYVTSLTNCYIYSLSGKRVQRTQVINLPSTCVDLRPDLLNVHLLTTLGLQTCSSGICDSILCYDWCSSADLNLSFTAIERTRILTSSSFIVLVSCSINGKCELEYIRKPSLSELYDRIVETVDHCDSVSIRANMLTYLHASIQLHLLVNLPPPLLNPTNSMSTQNNSKSVSSDSQSNRVETISILKTVTSLLCKQLLLKKQSNSMTNSRIDKAIIHLLDISMCDVSIVDLAPIHQ